MSRVKVYKYEPSKELGNYTFVRVEDGEATFCEWGVNFQEFESGPGNFSVAIVKRDDGTIEMPIAHMIQFIS